MTAIADRSAITNPLALWLLIAATTIAVLLFRAAARRLKAADQELTRTVDTILGPPTERCAVLTCDTPPATAIRGFALCTNHAKGKTP